MKQLKQNYIQPPPVPYTPPPAPMGFMVNSPEVYEFRVAEYHDTQGNIKKVALQMRTFTYFDQNGWSAEDPEFIDVPRVILPYEEK